MITEKKINEEYDGFTPFELRGYDGWVVGTYQHKEDRLCIAHAHCEGNFSKFAKFLVKKFKTNRILIYNVLSENWNLRGFKQVKIIDPYFKEEVSCLEGVWDQDKVPR